MSRTYRKVVWPWWRGGVGRDGFFNKHYPKYFYYTKKDKAPYVDPEELEVYCGLYTFEECWDIEEMELCWNCGQYYAKGDSCPC